MGTVQLLCYIIFITVSKSDYVLYEITAFNPRERALLYNLQSRDSAVIFLNGVSNEAALPMDVIVNKMKTVEFENRMRLSNIQYKREAQIKLEELKYEEHLLDANISNTFYKWDDILEWIEKKTYKNFKKVVISKTYEKRDIFFLKIGTNTKNPTVFIVGGEDGMDWISSAVILNLFNDLLENVDELRMLINNFNFYLMPVLNPDGFIYSKQQDRFWLKNRQQFHNDTKCEDNSEPIGVNIARNWFFQKTPKRVREECNAEYIDHRPLSQEESQSLSYLLHNLALHMIAFVNVRGFDRYITVPYADMSDEPSNHDIILEILTATSSKVRHKHNVTFYVGKTSNYFYNFTGNMADWVKKKLNTPLVYTLYLEDISSVIPNPKNIKIITKQFYTIINESLLVAKDIYKPLFNYAIELPICFLLHYTILLLQLLNDI